MIELCKNAPKPKGNQQQAPPGAVPQGGAPQGGAPQTAPPGSTPAPTPAQP